MRHTVETLGEDALLLRFGDAIDVTTNDRVHALARRIERVRPPWLRDLVPAYASLALFVDGDAFACDVDPLIEAGRWLQQQGFPDGDSSIAGQLVETPVHYGGEYGPDLSAVAAHAGLDEREVIARHCAVEYRVAMLGFAPGFPYLLGLDPILAMPRLDTPRTRVAAGSVGIGGAQTGIYPREGPGGWHVIGRTTRPLFDPAREPPALLAPGDRVRFVASTESPP
ncbi:MAG TPA: 5-oxoprolinase subunit PxpB [Luteimonas sp.]|nr:5-oxoprolinase subunit PxpB [Luteimonas sp.]